MKRRKHLKLLLSIFFICIFLIGFFIWGNDTLEVTKISYYNKKLPNSFEGFTIVQISDLHNKEFGKYQINLLNEVKNLNPDIIIITGDFIDSSHTNIEIAMDFAVRAVSTCPVYYVSGNHEAWSSDYNQLKTELECASVTIMDNRKIEISKDNSTIELYGISDPDFNHGSSSAYEAKNISASKLEALSIGSNIQSFKILLSHRPELLDVYEKFSMDLVFSGHAHGGQVRLPFVGGLVAPNQGIFPKYTSGSYVLGDTTMIVSRGLGNSIIPLRIFNRPEIIALTLTSEN